MLAFHMDSGLSPGCSTSDLALCLCPAKVLEDDDSKPWVPKPKCVWVSGKKVLDPSLGPSQVRPLPFGE